MRDFVRFLIRSAVLIMAAMSACQSVLAGFPELIRRVPGDANAIMLIDAERLFASPIAQREGWKSKQVAEFTQRPLAKPTQATKVVREAHADLQAIKAEWAIVLIELPNLPTLDGIAQREKGYVDRVANTKVVWSPRGAYVVKISDDAVGLVFPPNRQLVGRWLKQPSGKISDYLLQASRSMSASDAQLLLAMDLEDAVDPERVLKMLKDSSAVGAAKADPQVLARVLEDLRGIKFEVVFKEKAWGRLMLEFGHDPSPLTGLAKPLVIDKLRQSGAFLDDIDSWTVTRNGNSISLTGELSESGLLRFGSLFELPSIELDKAEEPVAADQPKLYATQNHFKAVGKLLNDLKIQKTDAKTIGQLALWVEQYAKRIDRLPLLNVDPDMQKYSAEMADDLRQMSLSMKQSGIRSGVRTATNDTVSGYAGSSYDLYYGDRQVAAEQHAIRAQEVGASALSSTQIADQIRAETSRVRRLMTERYKVEF